MENIDEILLNAIKLQLDMARDDPVNELPLLKYPIPVCYDLYMVGNMGILVDSRTNEKKNYNLELKIINFVTDNDVGYYDEEGKRIPDHYRIKMFISYTVIVKNLYFKQLAVASLTATKEVFNRREKLYTIYGIEDIYYPLPYRNEFNMLNFSVIEKSKEIVEKLCHLMNIAIEEYKSKNRYNRRDIFLNIMGYIKDNKELFFGNNDLNNNLSEIRCLLNSLVYRYLGRRDYFDIELLMGGANDSNIEMQMYETIFDLLKKGNVDINKYFKLDDDDEVELKPGNKETGNKYTNSQIYKDLWGNVSVNDGGNDKMISMYVKDKLA